MRLTKSFATAAVAALAFSAAGPALAADPDFTVTFPAGWACEFELQIDGWGGKTHYREFTDADGNTVRAISAGKGSDLVFTNTDSDATYQTKGNGAVAQRTFLQNGSQHVTLLGHNILIMFPTDIPAGPSTTLYVGRVEFTNSPAFVTTLQSTSGRSVDICEMVS